MEEHGTTPPGDGTTPVAGTASGLRRTLLRRALPTAAAAGLGITGIAGVAHGAVGSTPRAAADFPTWGTRWVVHASADTGSPAVGMINASAPGRTGSPPTTR